MRLTTIIPILFVIHITATSALGQSSSDLSQNAAPPSAKSHQAIQLKTPSGTLFGTLDLPTTDGPWPVALIIAGSGPTDRDGNDPTLKNDCLKQLGKALATHGIAALRYDKRCIGESAAAGPAEKDLKFDTYVTDARAWIEKLQHDNRFTKIAVIGHSEGSLIGMMAIKQGDGVDAFVSLEGAGRNIADVLREQLKKNLPADWFEQSDRIISELAAGHTVDKISPELAGLFRHSVQSYLISCFKYDPAHEIAALDIPILIVQGTTDMQVTQDDAKLLASANQSAKLALVPNMNHVLKHNIFTWKLAQLLDYMSPSPLEPQLFEPLLSFLDNALAAEKK